MREEISLTVIVACDLDKGKSVSNVEMRWLLSTQDASWCKSSNFPF